MKMHLLNKKILFFLAGLILIGTIAYYLSESYNYNYNNQKPEEAGQIQINKSEQKDRLDLFFSFLEYYELEEGDTFISTLKKTNLNNREIDQLIIAAQGLINTNQLRIGTRIEIISELINEKKIIKEVVIYPDNEEKISVLRTVSYTHLRAHET